MVREYSGLYAIVQHKTLDHEDPSEGWERVSFMVARPERGFVMTDVGSLNQAKIAARCYAMNDPYSVFQVVEADANGCPICEFHPDDGAELVPGTLTP